MVSLDSAGQDRLDAGFSSTAGGGVVVKDASGNVNLGTPPNQRGSNQCQN